MFTKHELETILYTLEGYIQGNDDDKLCDELVDICYRIERKLKDEDIIESQELEGDISTIRDSDYEEESNTEASEDSDDKYNFVEHTSECS